MISYTELTIYDRGGIVQPDYKNWVPKGMAYGLAAGTIALAVGNMAAWTVGKALAKTTRVVARAALSSAFVACGAFTAWTFIARRVFSFEDEGSLSRRIVEGTAKHVVVPEGGTCLDVGCGSGALSIAVAKHNPHAKVVGVDLWGAEYASFSQRLCEDNARAEGVDNTSFQPGDARHLPFEDESFDAVTSNYVYHNVVGSDKQDLLRETLRVLRKGGTFAIHDLMGPARYGDMKAFAESLRAEGYERVELIPTDNGLFMDKREATLMMLTGSTLLVGVK